MKIKDLKEKIMTIRGIRVSYNIATARRKFSPPDENLSFLHLVNTLNVRTTRTVTRTGVEEWQKENSTRHGSFLTLCCVHFPLNMDLNKYEGIMFHD
jgi:hypothetical protein